MLQSIMLACCVFVLTLMQAVPASAEQALKPYLLGFRGTGTIEAKLPEVKTALEQKGFQVVGEYTLRQN